MKTRLQAGKCAAWAGDAQDAQGLAPHAGGHDGAQTPAVPTTLNKTLRLSQRGSQSLSELRE